MIYWQVERAVCVGMFVCAHSVQKHVLKHMLSVVSWVWYSGTKLTVYLYKQTGVVKYRGALQNSLTSQSRLVFLDQWFPNWGRGPHGGLWKYCRWAGGSCQSTLGSVYTFMRLNAQIQHIVELTKVSIQQQSKGFNDFWVGCWDISESW